MGRKSGLLTPSASVCAVGSAPSATSLLSVAQSSVSAASYTAFRAMAVAPNPTIEQRE